MDTTSFTFKKFSDIENSSNLKIISKIHEFDLEENNKMWIALEKIHGCNFSFLVRESSENKIEIQTGYSEIIRNF